MLCKLWLTLYSFYVILFIGGAMARDKYLMYLRQQEYKKRIKLKVDNTRVRMNREYMNQPEVDKETLELWNNQPAIYFNLGGDK